MHALQISTVTKGRTVCRVMPELLVLKFSKGGSVTLAGGLKTKFRGFPLPVLYNILNPLCEPLGWNMPSISPLWNGKEGSTGNSYSQLEFGLVAISVVLPTFMYTPFSLEFLHI